MEKINKNNQEMFNNIQSIRLANPDEKECAIIFKLDRGANQITKTARITVLKQLIEKWSKEINKKNSIFEVHVDIDGATGDNINVFGNFSRRKMLN